MLGLIGWRVYVVVAIVLAFVAVCGYAAYARQQAQIATLKLAAAEKAARDLRGALAVSQSEISSLREKAKALDAINTEQKARLVALQADKNGLHDEILKIRGQLDEADKSCLARELPPAIVIFLRDGPDHHDADGERESTGQPPVTVH